MFYGLGSDGTVGANKSAVKMIAMGTELYAQAVAARIVAPPGKMNTEPEHALLKTHFLHKPVVFRFHVNLPGAYDDI